MFTKIIFVFGSNPEGRHGRGSAKFAHERFGAVYGQSSGLTGNAYGIVTKELRIGYPPIKLEFVTRQIADLHTFMKAHRDWLFLITPIGTNLAGFSKTDILPLLAPLVAESNGIYVDKAVPMEIPLRDLGEYHV